MFDAGGNPLDQDQDRVPGEGTDDRYVAEFAIRGPRVVGHTPAGPTAGPVAAVQLRFDQPMNPTSFDPAADIVSFAGPGGTLAATGFSWLDSQTLEVRFAARSAAGQYQLVLGPQVLDAEGNALDQDRDGRTGETPDDRYTAPFRISPYVSGTIAQNTIWSGLVAVRGAVTVAAGATLTVQPGTVVKFATSADGYTPGSLTVQGTLQVLGTASQPVIFTSLYDDAAGGDTDGDGGATAPRAGDWGFLQLASASASSSLDYAEIRYAGGGGFPEAALNIDFAFGYDTKGFKDFADSDFKNPLLLVNGLYVSDDPTDPAYSGGGDDPPELTFDGGLWAAAELNLGIARGGVGGGIFIGVDFNLFDIDGDGRVRLDELATNFLNQLKAPNEAERLLAPLAVFDVSGQVTAELFAFLKIDFGFWELDKKFNITPPAVLADFEIDFFRPPILATNVYRRQADGWRLVLHHASPLQVGGTPHPRTPPVVLH